MRLIERVRRLGSGLLAAILCVAMAATASGQTNDPASETAQPGSLRVATIDSMTVVARPGKVIRQLADGGLVLFQGGLGCAQFPGRS